MKISVVVITYNRKEFLKRCINSLVNQNFNKKDCEILIVDDGSNDGTKELIKNFQRIFSNIRYVYQYNKGFGAARNTGLDKAKGVIVAFTDDDCVVEKDWLKKIVYSFDRFSDATVVGGSILNPYNDKLSWAAYILNFSSWFPLGKVRKVRDIPTANIAYKKSDLYKLHFIEENKYLGYEDSIFNFQLFKLGKVILFDPNIKVYHYHNINNYKDFLINQQRYGKSFLLRGYKVHGFVGNILIYFKFLNLFCPRLIYVFFRCLKSKKYLYKFIVNFSIIVRGELERASSTKYKIIN